MNEILRLIGSHNLLATPTAAQLADPDLRPLIDRYLRGAKGVDGRGAHPRSSGSPGTSPAARWPAATSSTSASIWLGRAQPDPSHTASADRSGPTGWSTAS